MPSPDKLTPKQNAFARNLFKGMSERVAYINAGYSSSQLPATLDRNACLLAKNPKIVTRLAKLQAEADAAAIMSIQERKARLSEIGRARLVDFIDADGDVTLNEKIPNVGAVKKYMVKRYEVGRGDSKLPVIEKSIELYDPVDGVQELNKMDGVYEEKPPTTNNLQINIVVQTPQGQDLLRRVIEGERTEKELPGA